MEKQLNYYIKKFQNLKQGITKYGPAPHKPILLLSLLQAYRSQLYTENNIIVTPELVSLFTSNWNALVETKNVSNFALPFFHLSRERFWHLQANPGYETALNNIESISSLGQINTFVQSASLDIELFNLFKNHESNSILSEVLLLKYFPGKETNLSMLAQKGYKLYEDIKDKILHEHPEMYREEIERLIEQKNEDEIFIRSNIFKREIPLLYDNTCSISRLKITSTVDVSMIDACHIHRWSESHDDTRKNGIALCPNLHRAFDRGLITIDNNYRLLISSAFNENLSNYNISQFRDDVILLPKDIKDYPSLEKLDWHRKNIFRK
jgi:putative restriction endonuclease